MGVCQSNRHCGLIELLLYAWNSSRHLRIPFQSQCFVRCKLFHCPSTSLHKTVAEPAMRGGESSLPIPVAMCSLSFISLPLIIACLAAACWNHAKTNSHLDWQMFQAFPLTRAPSTFCITLFGFFFFFIYNVQCWYHNS
jgi:hypothetical protein